MSLSPSDGGPEVVLFFGGRDCTRESHGALIGEDIDALARGSIVIVGGQRGADTLAEQRARARGLHVARVDWRPDLYGRSAGPRRNAAMMLLRPHRAVGYPTGGPGSRDMDRRLHAVDVPVVLRYPNPQLDPQTGPST